MAKPNKPTGFRLTDEARSALEYTCDRKGWQFSVYVSALLENAVDDVSAHEAKVNEILERQKKAKTAAARAAAAGKHQWKTYSERWPRSPRGREESPFCDITWTRDEIEQISERFATVEYWGDKIDHWLATDARDRQRLTFSWIAVMSALPLPVRYRCLNAMHACWGDHGERLRDCFFKIFYEWPCLPITNKFTGVKLDAIEKMSGSFAEREIGTVTDVFDPVDWQVLDEMSEFYEKSVGIPYSEQNEFRDRPASRSELEESVANWREMSLPARFHKAESTLHGQAVEWGYDGAREIITPKPFAEMFSVVSSDSGKNFDILTGPHPRGRTIYQVAVALRVAEHFYIRGHISIADLYEVIPAKSVKSAITAILKDWSFFFVRELRDGEPKRGGYIHLSREGDQYFTEQRILNQLAPDYVKQDWKDLLDDYRLLGDRKYRIHCPESENPPPLPHLKEAWQFHLDQVARALPILRNSNTKGYNTEDWKGVWRTTVKAILSQQPEGGWPPNEKVGWPDGLD
ncbi:MAG: hypothetical protein CL569_07665 [Alphaproteobacteria bacterium]|nr:hypothetical protein [Alphaproteobacteria bacterium]|tara:strand:+ start:1983 stop:3533 length:1551 start_codon:yes stop_codon:yes gene_type:complete